MYSVRVSLLSPDGRRISPDEVRRSVGDLNFTLSREPGYHVLRIDGFQSEDEGSDFLKRMHTSIAWLLLERDVPLEVKLIPQRIAFCDDPMLAARKLSKSLGVQIEGPVDGILDGGEAAVFETNKKLRIITLGGGSAYVTVPAEDALNAIVQGSQFKGCTKFLLEPKLSVALKLYGAFFTEASPTARFLTLIMALEALATPMQRPAVTVKLLERWAAEVDALVAQPDCEPEDAHALQSLRQELLFRRESSIRSQIRQLVASTLQNDPDADHQTSMAVRLYDLRSRLVHDGTVNALLLDQGTADAKSLVLRVLRRRFSSFV